MSFTTTIETLNEFVGYHCWPDAPQEVAFLRSPHRHVFIVRCEFPVEASRALEFFMQERKVRSFFEFKYYHDEAGYRFEARSCEEIAREVLEAFPEASACSVSEDGREAARVRR